jgi:hypothetical protein
VVLNALGIILRHGFIYSQDTKKLQNNGVSIAGELRKLLPLGSKKDSPVALPTHQTKALKPRQSPCSGYMGNPKTLRNSYKPRLTTLLLQLSNNFNVILCKLT